MFDLYKIKVELFSTFVFKICMLTWFVCYVLVDSTKLSVVKCLKWQIALSAKAPFKCPSVLSAYMANYPSASSFLQVRKWLKCSVSPQEPWIPFKCPSALSDLHVPKCHKCLKWQSDSSVHILKNLLTFKVSCWYVHVKSSYAIMIFCSWTFTKRFAKERFFMLK